MTMSQRMQTEALTKAVKALTKRLDKLPEEKLPDAARTGSRRKPKASRDPKKD